MLGHNKCAVIQPWRHTVKKGLKNTIWPASQIHTHTHANKHLLRQTSCKEILIRSHSHTSTDTHTPIFVSASFSEGSVSASLWAIWESDWCCLHMRDPSLCMFSGCVWRRQWRRKPCLQASLYLICSCMQKVMCQTAMKVRPLRVTSLAQDAFVFLKPNTSTPVTRRAGCNWDVSGRGHTELLLVSVSPLLARYLIRDTPSLPSCLPPPPSSSSSLCLSVRHHDDILYSVHFWPTVLGNGFQTLQGGLNLCQSWKWKANMNPSPLCSYLAPM